MIQDEPFSWPEEFWPHQRRGCEAVVKAIENNNRRIVLTAPCGTGKSKMMCALVEYARAQSWSAILYTHRRLLLNQTSRVLTAHNIEHGLRASGFPLATLKPVQLAMIQTEWAAKKRGSRRPHDAQLVLTDELHAVGGESMPWFHDYHYSNGAAIVGVTATPIDLEGEWDELIVACTTSEGRACGALVPSLVYCPDEPDMKYIKNYKIGEDLTEKENRKAIMRPGVFGRVYQNWKRLNPTSKATILFAPDVAGSLFFAQQFTKMGVTTAHIDAKDIWVDGETVPSTDEERAQLLKRFEDGEIKVLCNRFILREAIDLPFVSHAIFACVVGSLKSWLQMSGRVIRAHPDTPIVIIQDHGANYRRHCHPDADHDWKLGLRGAVVTGLREDRMRDNPETEPIICPNCQAARDSGPVCPVCGFRCTRRARVVVQVDGTLKLVHGPAYRKRYVAKRPDTEALWKQMYWRARSKKWDATFRQAEALFAYENGYWPPRNLPLMPIMPVDWYMKVSEVPRSRLY